MDVICYVICCFDDENIIYVEGWVDLLDDIFIINLEFILVDLEIVEKCIGCVEKLFK